MVTKSNLETACTCRLMLQVAALEAVVGIQEQQLLQLTSPPIEPDAQPNIPGARDALSSFQQKNLADGPMPGIAGLLPRWRAETLRQYQSKLEAEQQLRLQSSKWHEEQRQLSRQLFVAQAAAQVLLIVCQNTCVGCMVTN
jgi:hypothetical protein